MGKKVLKVSVNLLITFIKEATNGFIEKHKNCFYNLYMYNQYSR